MRAALAIGLACALLASGCGESSGLHVENGGHSIQVTHATGPQPRVKSLAAAAFVSETRGWAAGTHTIIATADAGRTWTEQYHGGADIRALDFVDDRDGWAVAADTLLHTSDGGATWQTAGEPDGHVLTGVDFVSATRGWGVAELAGVSEPPGLGGSVVRTADGGESWSIVGSGTADSLCVAGDTLVAGSGSQVLHSTDDGTTWTPLFDASSSHSDWMGATVQCAGSSIWALFLGDSAAGSQAYAAYASADAGATWRPVVVAPILTGSDPAFHGVAQLDAYAGPFAAVTPSEAVFLGQCPACDPQHVTVLRTQDGGTTWERHVINGFVPTGLAFADAEHGWMTTQLGGYPGRHAAILATTDGGRSWHPVYPT